MKIKQNIVARDSQGNEYSTMEEIFGFRMPDFTLSISQFMEDLRKQGVLAGDEVITNVYTEDQISIEVKVRDDE